MISRRKLLHFSITGVALASSHPSLSLSKEKSDTNWRDTCRRWLNILMPKDEYGAGADNKIVWQYLNDLMKDKKFSEGIIAGFGVLDQIVAPPNDESLTKLMSNGMPIARFLNAFYEVVIEGYYGSEVGWRDIGLTHPPQPLGYVLIEK